MARIATLVGPDEDEDLVVVDLDDAPPPSMRFDREAFEERFAELAFGLGTVRRRIHPDRASRAPLWVLLLAVVAMLAVLVGGPGQSQSAAPASDATRLLEAPTEATVVVVAYDRIESVNVDRRVQNVVRLTGIPDGTATMPVSAGDTFAVIVRGHAWGINRRFDRPALDLGPADALFPSGAESWVWIAVATSAGWELREVSAATGERGGAFWAGAPPQTGTGRPVGVVQPDGLVLDGVEAGRRVVTWGTSARALSRRDVVLGLADTSVATLDCAGRTCSLVLSDLRSAARHRIDTPLPSASTIGPSAVSQGGGAVAVLTSPPGSDRSRVLVVTQGAARVVDVGGHANALAWSADWLFVTLDDGRLLALGSAGGAQTVDVSQLPHGALIAN